MTKKEKLEQRLQELRKDYERKLSSKEFEIKYNASYSTITRILYKHGIMVKNNSAPIKYQFLHDHIDEFKIDWINGILQKHDLEEKYCCSYNTLKSYATELNIKRKSKKEIVDNKAIIEDVLNDILTYDQIMEKYNISEHIIRTILKDNNISHKRDNRKYYFNINYLRDITLKWRGSSNQRVIDVQKSLTEGKVVLFCD